MLSSNTRKIFYTAMVLMLSGCGPLTEIATMSDADLRGELTQCHAIPNPLNSKAVACQNFTRECEKRVKKEGKYRDC